MPNESRDGNLIREKIDADLQQDGNEDMMDEDLLGLNAREDHSTAISKITSRGQESKNISIRASFFGQIEENKRSSDDLSKIESV